jgi:hypothetical protein
MTSSSVSICLGLSFFGILLGLLLLSLLVVQSSSLKDTQQFDECDNRAICCASSVALIMSSSNSESMEISSTSAYNGVNHLIGEILLSFIQSSSIPSIKFYSFDEV